MQKPTSFQVIKTLLGLPFLLLLIGVMFIGQIDGFPGLITGIAVLLVLGYAGRRLSSNRVVFQMTRDEEAGKLHLWGYGLRGGLKPLKSTLVFDEVASVRWVPSTWLSPSPKIEFVGKDDEVFQVIVSPNHFGADDVVSLNEYLAKDEKSQSSSTPESNAVTPEAPTEVETNKSQPEPVESGSNPSTS